MTSSRVLAVPRTTRGKAQCALTVMRERATPLIMKVFAAQGKRAKVKEQFENLQDYLKKELGVAPAPETRRVFQELLK